MLKECMLQLHMCGVTRQTPVIQRVDNAMHRIDRYPVDKFR